MTAYPHVRYEIPQGTGEKMMMREERVIVVDPEQGVKIDICLLYTSDAADD